MSRHHALSDTMFGAAGVAGLGLVLVIASAVEGQGVPRQPGVPARPSAPPSPASPNAPADPAGPFARQLSLAFLQINGRQRTVDSLAVDVAGGLLAVTGAAHDVRPLSRALVEALYGRQLRPEVRDRLAGSLVDALSADDLPQAMHQVRVALAAAGLGGPAIVIVETELRRLTGKSR